MKLNKSLFMTAKKDVFRDQFGNEVNLIKQYDGRFKTVIQTDINSEFEFMGEIYSCYILMSAETVKVYWDEYHSIRELVKDKYGRLFHYRYDEEMRFDGGPDREDFLWTLVESESQSDQLSQLWSSFLLVEPFIAGDETGWMSAHEYVDKAFLENLKAKPSIWKRIGDILQISK
jgi:hypothetical protein